MIKSKEQIMSDVADTIRPERMTPNEAITYLQDLVDELTKVVRGILQEREELNG